MLIKLNSTPAFIFEFPTGTIPNRYWVIRSNEFHAIPAVPAGAGTITNVYHATGAVGTWKVQLAAGETDTLGDLGIVVDDSVVQSRWVGRLQVVDDLPGGDVANVLGDVDGSVMGPMPVGTRLAIATDVWTQVDAIELGLTAQNALRAMFSVLAGKSVVSPGGVSFRNFGDTKNRVIVAYLADGTRTAVICDFS